MRSVDSSASWAPPPLFRPGMNSHTAAESTSSAASSSIGDSCWDSLETIRWTLRGPCGLYFSKAAPWTGSGRASGGVAGSFVSSELALPSILPLLAAVGDTWWFEKDASGGEEWRSVHHPEKRKVTGTIFFFFFKSWSYNIVIRGFFFYLFCIWTSGERLTRSVFIHNFTTNYSDFLVP